MSLFKARKFGCTLGFVVKCNVLFHVSVCKWVWTWWKSHLKLGLIRLKHVIFHLTLWISYLTQELNSAIPLFCIKLQEHKIMSTINVHVYSSKLKKYKSGILKLWGLLLTILCSYFFLNLFNKRSPLNSASCLWHSLQQSCRGKQIYNVIWCIQFAYNT